MSTEIHVSLQKVSVSSRKGNCLRKERCGKCKKFQISFSAPQSTSGFLFINLRDFNIIWANTVSAALVFLN